MTSLELLQAIGSIDDRFIERAERNTATVKRIKAICGAAAAACLLFAVFISIKHLTLSDNDPVEELPPMVFVNSTLYTIQPEDWETFSGEVDDLVYLGKISSIVEHQPDEEFQSNDNILGASVYQYGEKLIVAFQDKSWIYFPEKEKSE